MTVGDYTRVNFVDDVTELNQTNMNNMDAKIEELDTFADAIPLDNLTATTDPTVNDDSGDGYGVGSSWANVTLDKFFVCVDATVGAAVWNDTAAAGGGVQESDFNAHTILQATSDDTPVPITIAEQRIIGRITSGNIKALTAAEVLTLINVADGADVSTLTKLDDFATPDDNTDLNATLTEHGLLLKLGGGTTNFLRADGTWSVPAGGGDMALDAVQTVTGAKTFNDAKLILAGLTSGTTVLKSGAIAGSSVITLPVATDTLVGKATTDTFTNKTFDANGSGNVLSNVDVADMADGTDGELITWDAAGNPAVVAVGTATHVLTSNGPGAAPTFQTSAGGAANADVPLTAAGCYLPITNPANYDEAEASTIYAGHGYLGFDDTTNESAFWWMVTPELPSTLNLDIYWYATATTGDVIWNIGLITFGDGDAWQSTNPTVTAIAADTVAGTTLYLNKTTVSAYNPASTTNANEVGLLQLQRDAASGSDTLSGDAKVLFVLPSWVRT